MPCNDAILLLRLRPSHAKMPSASVRLPPLSLPPFDFPRCLCLHQSSLESSLLCTIPSSAVSCSATTDFLSTIPTSSAAIARVLSTSVTKERIRIRKAYGLKAEMNEME